MSDALDFKRLIREGETLAWTGGTAEPSHSLAALNAQLDDVPPSTALIGLNLAETVDLLRLAKRMRVKVLGGASTNRRLQDVGALDVLPCHYSATPDLVAQGVLEIDVAMVQLAADGDDDCRLTAMIDYVADALPRARLVIGEVNEQAPCLLGDTAVARADIDHLVHVSYPLIEVPPAPIGPLERTIGEHVARLVPDGATLQVGLGALPDAVLEALGSKKDLGLHSGTISDGVVSLVESGVITNRRKPVDTGLCVTAGLIGTSRLYKWAHRNELLRLRSPRYTHDYLVTSQIPSLYGINTALEVDLTGQMNAEVAGTRHVGLVGGHADFMRGAMRSRGGRGIVAMQSTARGGSVSRIVSRLAGGIVTTSRSDADVVVTEYGVAELRGRTVSERAKALIAIAHPDFRNKLEAEAEKLI
jgi:4-hydroxybutyrate CoA-transferase